MPTPDADKLWSELDALGTNEVRIRLAQQRYAQAKVPLVEEWLRRQDAEQEQRNRETASHILKPSSWNWIERTAAIITISGFIVVGAMRLGQTDLGYQLLGRKAPLRAGSQYPPQEGVSTSPGQAEGTAAEAVVAVPAGTTSTDTHDPGPMPKGLFSPGTPFPWPFSGYKLGIRMSVFLAAFPDARRSMGRSLWIEFPESTEAPFGYAIYRFDNDRIDPASESVTFQVKRLDDDSFRADPEASEIAWREVLGAFQSYAYEQSKVNKTVYWDDVNGYVLALWEDGDLNVEAAD